MIRRLLSPALLAGLAFLLPVDLAAQQEGISRAFDLERRGEYAAAAEAYRATLASRPGDPAALLGLERVLLPLNRGAEILPEARAALAANPRSGALYGVALRAWAAAGEADSLRATAERWARMVPGDEAPYREWGAAALQHHDRASAREAYALARTRLGRRDVLAAEMAQLAVSEGDFPGALREWIPAIRQLPGYRVSAVSTLAKAPPEARPELLQALGREPDFAARRLEAELRIRWGDPLGGLAALEGALPSGRGQAVDALRGVVEQLRGQRSQEAMLARARALEAIAARSTGSFAARTRLEAAQEYSAAGDSESARRMLESLAQDGDAPPGVGAGAATTLLTVMIADGKLHEAAARLEELRPTLSSDEYLDLRRRIAQGWLRAGNLDRADTLLGADTSIDGLALRGRIQLYRGDIGGAVKSFQSAGPYAGDRAEATRRTALLALLQPIEADTLRELGAALWRLERGDTAEAVKGLEEVAGTLPVPRGGAELRLLGGRLAAASGNTKEAERLLREAATAEAPGTAPAAELALAELLLAGDRPDEARALLEHLILTYAESALVPQARRMLDQARGGVPET